MENQSSNTQDSKRKHSSKRKHEKEDKTNRKTYYCKNHGENLSHKTKNCLNNKRAKYNSKYEHSGPSTKELNALVKSHISRAFSKATKSKKKEQYVFEKFRELHVSDDSDYEDNTPAEKQKPMFLSSSSSKEANYESENSNSE